MGESGRLRHSRRDAERAKVLRDELSKSSLASLSAGALGKGMTKEFLGEVKLWFSDRQTAREDARITGIRARSTAGEDDE